MTAPQDCVVAPDGRHSHEEGRGKARRHTWVAKYPDYAKKETYCTCVFCGGIVPDGLTCDEDARRGDG